MTWALALGGSSNIQTPGNRKHDGPGLIQLSKLVTDYCYYNIARNTSFSHITTMSDFQPWA